MDCHTRLFTHFKRLVSVLGLLDAIYAETRAAEGKKEEEEEAKEEGEEGNGKAGAGAVATCPGESSFLSAFRCFPTYIFSPGLPQHLNYEKKLN